MLTRPPPSVLDPDSQEARELLRRELARPEYHEPVSLLQRLQDWIQGLYDQVVGNAAASADTTSKVVILVVAVLVAALLAWALPRVRRGQAVRRRPGGDVIEDPRLSARDYRERAARALGRGRWDEALLDGYRAIATDAGERTLLDDLPGRTAHEVAVSLGRTFPGHRDRLAQAADRFDAVRYGGRRASEEQARDLQALDREVSAARPHHDVDRSADQAPGTPYAGKSR